MSTCSCGAEIDFMELAGGSKMPYRPDSVKKRLVRYKVGGIVLGKIVDTFEPHFADCPDAEQYRKKR